MEEHKLNLRNLCQICGSKIILKYGYKSAKTVEEYNEPTKIEKASFPYKTAIPEANIKTNRMVTTKWAYHRERSFTSNYFIFLKVLLQFKNLL